MATERASGPVGCWCPLITPLTDDSVDEPALRRQVERLIDGVDGFLVLGTTGERALLPESVADRAVAIAHDAVGGRRPLAIGVGAEGESTVRQRIAAAGLADYVAICAPYYYPVVGAALIDLYRRVADDSPKPVVLYNIPQNTVNRLTIDDVAQLAPHPNIVGIKDSAGDLTFIRQLLELRQRLGLTAAEFTVLQGSAERIAALSWLAGIDGFVSGLENIDAGLQQKLAAAARSGDLDALWKHQRRLDLVCSITEVGFWLAALKTAVSLLGCGNGLPAAPLRPSTPHERADIAALLVELGLLQEPSRRPVESAE